MSSPRIYRWFLKVAASRDGDQAILRVAGRIGARDAGQLLSAGVAALEQGALHLVIDLSGTDYIDSAGAMALSALAGRTAVAKGSLRLCAPSEPLRAALAIAPTMLDVPIDATIEDARMALAGIGTE
jgi:anti-anti-sigma factor